jgi:hypothetical protein
MPMANKLVLFCCVFLVLSGCAEDRGITFTDPNKSSVWTSEELFHTIEWRDEEGRMMLEEGSLLLLYKGEKALGPMEIWAQENGRRLVVMYPKGVPEGSDYRLRFKDNEERVGFSDYFTIKP